MCSLCSLLVVGGVGVWGGGGKGAREGGRGGRRGRGDGLIQTTPEVLHAGLCVGKCFVVRETSW